MTLAICVRLKSILSAFPPPDLSLSLNCFAAKDREDREFEMGVIERFNFHRLNRGSTLARFGHISQREQMLLSRRYLGPIHSGSCRYVQTKQQCIWVRFSRIIPILVSVYIMYLLQCMQGGTNNKSGVVARDNLCHKCPVKGIQYIGCSAAVRCPCWPGYIGSCMQR